MSNESGLDDNSTKADSASLKDYFNNDKIEDCDNNLYAAGEVFETILMYKKYSINFFWGDLMNNCNKTNRTIGDSWYKWSEDMLKICDANEMKMKKILRRNSHSDIQKLCKEAARNYWELKSKDKIKKLISDLRTIEKRIKTGKGMKTCWGYIKYDSVFLNNLRNKNKKNADNNKNIFDFGDYFKYLRNKWCKHYENFKEKEDVSKFYKKY